MKRYAIVRVDDRCPDFFCKYKVMKNEKSFSCNDCNLHRKYGDTKEQLVKKVAQVFFKRKLKAYKKLFDIVPNKADAKQVYKCCLEVAKEIVEFLGVGE